MLFPEQEMRMSFLDAHNLTSKCSGLTQETKFTEKEVIEINADSKDKIFQIEVWIYSQRSKGYQSF